MPLSFTARVKIKDCEPLWQDRPYVLFFCELLLDGEVVSDSGIWTKTEDDAVKDALAELIRKPEVTRERTNYHPAEFEWQMSPWDQTLRDLDPEHIEMKREIWDGINAPSKD